MTSSMTNPVTAFAPIAHGVALAARGIYVVNAEAAPGAVVLAFLMMAAAVPLGVRIARNRLPIWAGRTALAVGVLIAAFAAFLIHAATVSAPLFAQPPDVPSVGGSAPSPQWAAAIDRARPIVRAAVMEQNLSGVSVAVGTGGTIVWAEGFGWRDVGTHTPVTPATRFNIGTAAPVITAAGVASLGMTNTGTDSAAAWSPEAIGEPGEDFPPFTFVRHVILQPIGLPPPVPITGRSRDVLRPGDTMAGRHDRSPPGATTDVHARPGVLRGWEGVLFHAVRSRPLRPGDETRQRQRRARRRKRDVAADAPR